ncbi:hypothetical protein N9N28_01110 [Rubripirellula amarantea]|nr:hypothetical protein [Rubripirellula amarantea]
MDGTTEPIIVVIGHPIAGNPSQLAIERSLAKLGLEWRVLSFDVAPDDVAKALDGFSVTGIQGVMIDPSIRNQAMQWYAQYAELDEAAVIDCLDMGDDGRFKGTYERKNWINDLIDSREFETTRWIGELPSDGEAIPPVVDPDKLSAAPSLIPPEPETIAAADLILLADLPAEINEDDPLEAEAWPENDGTSLVIDLTSGHVDAARIARRGYQFVSALEIQTGTLQRCLHRWTGEDVSSETIAEAIEEYLGV